MAKRIGETEEALFVLLHDLVFLDVDFLSKYVYVHEDTGKSYSRVWISKQTRALEAEGYIKSFPVAKATVRGNDRLVYTLDKKGVEEVREILGDANWDNRWTDRTPTYVYHSIQVAHILGAYSIAKNETFRFKDYYSERRAYRSYGDSKSTVIRPDGAFVIERELSNDKTIQMLYLVEMERSRQRIEVTLNKIKRYNEYVRKTFKAVDKENPSRTLDDVVFGESVVSARILFVSANKTERDQLMRNAKKADHREILKVGGALMFATYEDVLENPHGQIWKAANSTDEDRLYRLYDRIE